MTAKLLVFGYGNPSRGDDALGPLLLERLEQRLDTAVRTAAGGIEFLTDFQLQIDHALDLAGRDLVLFVDAHVSCEPPFTLIRLREAEDRSYTTHALSPSAVLRVYREINGIDPPPSYLLSIRGISFELGENLTAAASIHLDAATDLVAGLCAHPHLNDWEARCSYASGQLIYKAES